MSVSITPAEEIGKDKEKEVHNDEEVLQQFRCLRHSGVIYHDLFVSYRVDTEKKVADKLALLLDSQPARYGGKLKTFLDANCLLDGGNWEKNFMSALQHAKMLVLLISEAGLDLRSYSNPEKTKIQNADHEQDNCLLEYEKALDLLEKGKTNIFVLAVMNSVRFGSTWAKVKIPTSPEGIAKRLQMYENTGQHHHRDGTKGPPVIETMGKLFSLMEEAKRNKTFVHVDPDDVASRVPIILQKLRVAEDKHTIRKKAHIIRRNIPYLKSKLTGVLTGMFLPMISLLFIAAARSPIARAYRVGVVAGHAIDFFVVAIAFFAEALIGLPPGCGSVFDCLNRVTYLAQTYPNVGLFTDPVQCIDYSLLPVNVVPGCTAANLASNLNCGQCFCDNYLLSCDSIHGRQQVYLFVAILCVIAGIAVSIVTWQFDTKIGKKKTAERL